MNILAFDPGHQTGVAFLIDQYWQFGMTVLTPALTDDLFHALVSATQPTIVVVEEAPIYQRDNESMFNYDLICHWFHIAGYNVAKVKPGQWKGMIPEKPNISGQHQLDAVTMAVWYYRSEKRKLVNIFGGDNEQKS